MKAGSADVVAEFVFDARGAAIASGSDMPKSMRLRSVCRTVVMIVAPPGLPTVSHGRPRRRTIVGAMLERGRLPPCGRLGSGEPSAGGAGSKSVSSLLSRKPYPGTAIPLPAICSIVLVKATTLPSRSTTVRWLVEVPSRPDGAEPDCEEHDVE